MLQARLPVPYDSIASFCRKWKVKELSLFGSVLRDDFLPESDVDVLVVFEDDATWSYWDWPDMIADLKSIFERPIDLVERKTLTNPFRRHRILSTRKVVYAA